MFLTVQAVAAGLSDVGSEPLEQKLAILNVPGVVPKSPDPHIVARFRSLLDQLVQKHPSENEYDIGGYTFTMQMVMEKSGIEESLLNIMEGVNSLNQGSGHRLPTYKDCATVYVTLRVQGKSHRAAVAVLPGYIEALRADGSIK
jgi:hypothetical protein